MIKKHYSNWIQKEHTSIQSKQYMTKPRESASCTAWGKVRSISTMTQNQIRMSSFTFAIQYYCGNFSQNHQAKKIIILKCTLRKRSQCNSVCRWHNPIYTWESKHCTTRLLELKEELGKAAGYKINTKIQQHLYT